MGDDTVHKIPLFGRSAENWRSTNLRFDWSSIVLKLSIKRNSVTVRVLDSWRHLPDESFLNRHQWMHPLCFIRYCMTRLKSDNWDFNAEQNMRGLFHIVILNWINELLVKKADNNIKNDYWWPRHSWLVEQDIMMVYRASQQHVGYKMSGYSPYCSPHFSNVFYEGQTLVFAFQGVRYFITLPQEEVVKLKDRDNCTWKQEMDTSLDWRWWTTWEIILFQEWFVMKPPCLEDRSRRNSYKSTSFWLIFVICRINRFCYICWNFVFCSFHIVDLNYPRKWFERVF